MYGCGYGIVFPILIIVISLIQLGFFIPVWLGKHGAN